MINLIRQVYDKMRVYTQIVEICNLYRLRNESAEGCMKLICNLIYGEKDEFDGTIQ